MKAQAGKHAAQARCRGHARRAAARPQQARLHEQLPLPVVALLEQQQLELAAGRGVRADEEAGVQHLPAHVHLRRARPIALGRAAGASVPRAVRLPVKRAVQASGDPAVGLVRGVRLA